MFKRFQITGKHGAFFSSDRIYRYLLWRRWDETKPIMTWILLNPSVAGEDTDDHTVKKMNGFAKKHSCGGLIVSNLYSYVSTT